MEQVAGETDAKFVLSVGDNYYFGKDVRDGTDYDWDAVRDVDDIKFTTLWKNTYTGKLSQIPWFIVQGNHDWRVNPQAQVDYSKKDPMWVYPDFFWEKVVALPTTSETKSIAGRIEVTQKQQQQEAAFIFIDTQLLAYGYKPDKKWEPGMEEVFQKMGWTPDSGTIEAHIQWVKDALNRHNDKDYVFVVGHHALGVCEAEGQTGVLMDLFQQHHVTAYFFGHVHAMQHARLENTFYVESGAGSKRSKTCKRGPLLGTPGEWRLGGGLGGVNGFVKGTLDAEGFSVKYYDQDGKVLHESEKIGPRAEATVRNQI